ncbi:MAG: hypothetical protein MZV70_45485 [Desulfobacterales bacterium]|nr:hypothetical protein [Desulfobacterales bacterium]
MREGAGHAERATRKPVKGSQRPRARRGLQARRRRHARVAGPRRHPPARRSAAAACRTTTRTCRSCALEGHGHHEASVLKSVDLCGRRPALGGPRRDHHQPRGGRLRPRGAARPAASTTRGMRARR